MIKYELNGKFELAAYHDDLKTFKGGSYIMTLSFSKNIIDEGVKKDLDNIMDRLDHCTLISKDSAFAKEVTENSCRYILFDGIIRDNTPNKIVFNAVVDYMKDKNIDNSLLLITSKIDFLNETIITKNGHSGSIEFSDGIFNS